MRKLTMSKPPDTNLETVKEWFARAAQTAKKQGRNDSFLLWDDGLQHLIHMESEIDHLKSQNAELEQRDEVWRAKKAMLENDLAKTWKKNEELLAACETLYRRQDWPKEKQDYFESLITKAEGK